MNLATRKELKHIVGIGVAVVLVGCAIHQKVDPVPRTNVREICIINNPNVREGFLESYRRALSTKGFETKLLDKSATPSDCPLASTYTANWRWDLALYMAFAEITVYVDGKKVGRALYDSLGGGGNPAKFINADNKVQELVDQLFPNPAPAS